MATLFILIPFRENDIIKTKDLPKEAIAFRDEFATMSNKRIGDNIGETVAGGISVVYLDSRFAVTADDFIIVFAHGSDLVADKLYSNDPRLQTPTADVIAQLEAGRAQTARKILFMCCFSALPGHIAVTWKAKYRAQVVYGGNAAISNLYSATRTQIRACCLALYTLA
jgi:hypothetical protein